MSTPSSLELETLRVRSAYARRDVRRDQKTYSYFNVGNLFIIQERERRLLALLARHGYSDLSERSILEVGCGSGFWMRQFIHWGAKPENIAGVDLRPECITKARHLCPAGVKLDCLNAMQLPYGPGAFDLVMQSTTFSSILDSDTREQVAAEMLRVVKHSGAILWYDFFVNNPANHDVRAVRKEEIDRLFPGCKVFTERVTLAPPLARRLARFSWSLCQALVGLRILNTHYVALIRARRVPH
jgi:ubiquinone/menaquinone biosynthesis C-methylase UbiE